MSRLGKNPIAIPEKTNVVVNNGVVFVKGPHGELSRGFDAALFEVAVSAEGVSVSPKVRTLSTKALWGTYASHIKNMLHGVTTPFQKVLVIEGVGYRAEVKGEKIILHVGFSHPVEMAIPKEVAVKVEKNRITMVSINKESLGAFAAGVRSWRKPEPYKGKGFRYEGEVIRRKQGKRAA